MSFSRQPPLLVPQLKRPRPSSHLQPSSLLLNTKRFERSTETSVENPTEATRKPTTVAKNSVTVDNHKKLTHQQEEQKSKDRLSTLYSRLQEEAEKIRKWKTLTELELKQKDQSLQEAKMTIEKQRKQISDVQLEKESLNSCIKDTVANQTEIHEKINCTREMCHALKEHTVHIEESIAQGERDRTVLVEQKQAILEQYNELVYKLHQLEQVQSDNHAIFEAQILKEKGCNEELKLQLLKLTKDSENKVLAVQEQLIQCNTELDKCHIDLESTRDCVSELTEQKGFMENNLQSKETQVSSLMAEIESYNCQLQQKTGEIGGLKQDITIRDSEIKGLKLEIIQLKERMVTMETQYTEKIKKLEHDKEELGNTLRDTNEKLRCVEMDLSSSEDAKMVLQNKCSGFETTLQTQTEEISSLLEKLAMSADRYEEISNEHKSVQRELVVCKTQLEGVQQFLIQKEEERETMSLQLNQALENEKKTAASTKQQLLETQNQLDQENHELMNKLQTTEKDNVSLEAQISCLESTLKHTTDEMNTEALQLKEKVSIAESEIERLQKIVESLNKSVEDKDCSIVSLKEQVAQLVHTGEEKDITLGSLRDKQRTLESELSSRDDRISLLTKDLETIRGQLCSLTKAKANSESILQQRSNKHQQTVTDLQQEITKLKEKLKNSAVKEKELKASIDAQANELGITLETYKAENTRIVALKDKELKNMKEKETKEKEQLMATIKNLEERDANSLTMKQENQQLKKELCDLRIRCENTEEELTQLLRATRTLQLVQKANKTPPTHLTRPKQYPQPHSQTDTMNESVSTTTGSTPVPFSPRVSSTPFNTRPKPFSTGRTPCTTEGRLQTTKSFDRKKVREEDSPDRNILSDNEPSYKKRHRALMTPKRSTPHGGVKSSKKLGLKRKPAIKKDKNQIDNLSWFDIDPIYGFPPED